MRLRLWSAVVLVLVFAVPAGAAETVLLADDMEGAPDAKWVVSEPTNPLMEPWQKSDSSAPKVRSNQAHGGATSYWAGMKPEGMHPNDAVRGEIALTSKAPIIIPADGKTTVSFWSLFQNEGDDAGQFEAALASNATAKDAWKKVAAVRLVPAAITDAEYRPGYCNPRPETLTAGFEEITGDFVAFAGMEVFVRFSLKYGSENRISSMPCGWYVDDLKVSTTGTPGKLAALAGTLPAVKIGALKAKGKKATLKLTVSGGDVKNAAVTLLKGKKKIATAKAASLAVGARSLTFKLKKKLAKGSYAIKFTGSAADGSAVTASGKAKAR